MFGACHAEAQQREGWSRLQPREAQPQGRGRVGAALRSFTPFYASPPREAQPFTRPSPISQTPDPRPKTLNPIQRTFHANSRLLHDV